VRAAADAAPTAILSSPAPTLPSAPPAPPKPQLSAREAAELFAAAPEPIAPQYRRSSAPVAPDAAAGEDATRPIWQQPTSLLPTVSPGADASATTERDDPHTSGESDRTELLHLPGQSSEGARTAVQPAEPARRVVFSKKWPFVTLVDAAESERTTPRDDVQSIADEPHDTLGIRVFEATHDDTEPPASAVDTEQPAPAADTQHDVAAPNEPEIGLTDDEIAAFGADPSWVDTESPLLEEVSTSSTRHRDEKPADPFAELLGSTESDTHPAAASNTDALDDDATGNERFAPAEAAAEATTSPVADDGHGAALDADTDTDGADADANADANADAANSVADAANSVADADAADADREVAVDAVTVDAPEAHAAPLGLMDSAAAPTSLDEERRAAGAPSYAAGSGVLSVSGLSKRFGDTVAVDGIDLEVSAGSFYGIVGPNGAGKTTTLSMITGLLRPDAGSITINGIDVWKEPDAAKRSIGVLPDHLRLFDRLTGSQLLYYSGVLRGIDGATVRSRVDDLAKAFGLEDALHRLVTDYSAGMTKKVALAAAMIHSPRMLVLDEPFESVDPVSAANVIEILQKYVDHGGTVVLSSHGMDLIQRVCDHVAIIVNGQVLAQGSVDEVRGTGTLEERFVELAGGRKAAEGMEWLHSFSD
jgi:ABC-2 type transport system ATP-binding protein